MSKLALDVFNDTLPTTTSNSKVTLSKSFVVTRANTTSTLRAVLPAAAYIVNQVTSNLSNVASNAVTTAAVNVFGGLGVTQISSTDVKTAAAPGGASALVNLDVAAAAAGLSDQQIFAQYADTGGAATLGGPWLVTIEYVV